MKSRPEEVVHCQVWGIVKLILVVMVAVLPAFHASSDNQAYANETRSPINLPFQKCATDRLLELINDGPFELKGWPGRDTDRYGRKLRVLVRDGRSLGDILVSEGLARTWSGRREPWC